MKLKTAIILSTIAFIFTALVFTHNISAKETSNFKTSKNTLISDSLIDYKVQYTNKNANDVTIHWGINNWTNIKETKMEKQGNGLFEITLNVPEGSVLDYCFHITSPNDYWDNNNNNDWHILMPDSKVNSNFSWDNAIVYFVITDRFVNGDKSNDFSYGRRPDDGGDNGKNIGTFHGGDLKGLRKKIEEGYFNDLGINALWISCPLEQIHGWVGGGGGDFKHYAYHGYYILDYTKIDANMGTAQDLKNLVDAAHDKKIRVLMDIVMNHPGYNTIKDMNEFGFGKWKGAPLDDATFVPNENGWHGYHNFIDYNSGEELWQKWWGSDWIRSGIAGYTPGGNNDVDRNVDALPDFKTESTNTVQLPPILKNKKDTLAVDLPNTTVRGYLVKWLTDWVREMGIDGFRCDTVKHVEGDSWKELKKQSTKALREWKNNNPDKKIDNNDFWMVGEVYPHSVNKTEHYGYGFDCIINFDFQKVAASINSFNNINNIENIYSYYARSLNTDPDFNVLSYISSHDTQLYYAMVGQDTFRQKLGGTLLLLCPGAVQVFYGDENARNLGPECTDQAQRTRSDMPWPGNTDVYEHWKKISRFRNLHPAIGAGMHKQISSSPYAFSRTLGNDKVVCALGVTNTTTLDVSSIFKDNTTVRDFYTGQISKVSSGKVSFTPNKNGVLLIENCDN